MNPLASLLDGLVPLTAVAEGRDPEPAGVVAVRLTFAAADVFLRVDEATDEVLCLSALPSDLPALDWEPSPAWAPALRKRLAWFWVMRNNQGYDDGLQAEFCPLDGGDRVTLQVVAIASRLSIRVVSERPHRT